MNTPTLDKFLNLIKSAKTDNEIKLILAQLATDAQYDSRVANECIAYTALMDLE